MSIYQSLLTGAMKSWSQHQKLQEEMPLQVYINVYVCILILKSVLQSSTELARAGYIYIYIYI